MLLHLEPIIVLYTTMRISVTKLAVESDHQLNNASWHPALPAIRTSYHVVKRFEV